MACPPQAWSAFYTGAPQADPQVALQAAMNQASGAGEATSSMLKNSIVAATVGTEHEGKFNTDYVVTSARRRHPEVFAPVKAITNEDTGVEWLTAGNLNGWTGLVKKELIDIGVVFDKPGHISK